MCISEAILDLMDHTEFEKLRVSAIVKRAGVSRMTFYKYYASPYEALTDYLKILIEKYIRVNEQEQPDAVYFEYSHILFSLKYFDQYSHYFVTMARHNLHSILLAGINQFMTERIHIAHPLSIYKILSYSGGLLNVFLEWELTDKKDSVEEVAKSIYEFYNFTKS